MFTSLQAQLPADGVGWDHMGGWNHMNGWGWGGMVLGWVLIVALVLFAVWAFAGRGGDGSGQRQTPLDVLETRFAQGEITADEYRARRDVLLQPRPRRRK
jgi:putative membrane protein